MWDRPVSRIVLFRYGGGTFDETNYAELRSRESQNSAGNPLLDYFGAPGVI